MTAQNLGKAKESQSGGNGKSVLSDEMDIALEIL